MQKQKPRAAFNPLHLNLYHLSLLLGLTHFTLTLAQLQNGDSITNSNSNQRVYSQPENSLHQKHEKRSSPSHVKASHGHENSGPRQRKYASISSPSDPRSYDNSPIIDDPRIYSDVSNQNVPRNDYGYSYSPAVRTEDGGNSYAYSAPNQPRNYANSINEYGQNYPNSQNYYRQQQHQQQQQREEVEEQQQQQQQQYQQQYQQTKQQQSQPQKQQQQQQTQAQKQQVNRKTSQPQTQQHKKTENHHEEQKQERQQQKSTKPEQVQNLKNNAERRRRMNPHAKPHPSSNYVRGRRGDAPNNNNNNQQSPSQLKSTAPETQDMNQNTNFNNNFNLESASATQDKEQPQPQQQQQPQQDNSKYLTRKEYRVRLNKCPRTLGHVMEASPEINMRAVYDEVQLRNMNESVENMILDPAELKDRWTPANKLKVILVPHTHLDPGWGETFENYYRWSAEKVLNQMLENLDRDPELKFIWTEMAFFSVWWEGLSEDNRLKVQKLLKNKQLEFVTGGWVTADEMNPHYYSLVTQLFEGHLWLKQHLNYHPKNAWSIDLLGSSPVNAYLLRRMGMKNLVLQKNHHAIKRYLATNRDLEFNWQQSWDPKSSADMFCHMLPYSGYDVSRTCGPSQQVCCQFDFFNLPSVNAKSQCTGKQPEPISATNVEAKAMNLLDQYRRQAQLFKTSTLLVPFGGDFRWEKKTEWTEQFTNYRNLFLYLNSQNNLGIEATVGSLEDYFHSVNEEVLAGRFTPKTLSGSLLANDIPGNNSWSGYYTSRPFHKYTERQLMSLIRSAQNAFVLMTAEIYHEHGDFVNFPFVQNLIELLVSGRRSLSMFQNHNAIAGMSKHHVLMDYAEKLSKAITDSQHVLQQSLHVLMNLKNPLPSYSDMQREASFLKPIHIKEKYWENFKSDVLVVDDKESMKLIVVFNSLSKTRIQLVTCLVSSSKVKVKDSDGHEMEHEIFPVFTKEGAINNSVYELNFLSKFDALETKRFVIVFAPTAKKLSTVEVGARNLDVPQKPHEVFGHIRTIREDEAIRISNHYMALYFDNNGVIEAAAVNGTEFPMRMKFLQYDTYSTNVHLFKAVGKVKPYAETNQPTIIYVFGRLQSYVEIWLRGVKQRITIYNHLGLESYAIDVRNTLDIRDDYREVVMRVETNIESENLFYTDLNGFTIAERKFLRKLPVESNYYPIPTSAYIEDGRLRMTILTDQPLGGSSLGSGELEIMMDSRLGRKDDHRGLAPGVIENLEATYQFKIMLEIPACPEPEKGSTPQLSLPANLQLHFLLNPLVSFYKPQPVLPSDFLPSPYQLHNAKTIRMNLADAWSDHKVFNSFEMACELQLVGLIPMSVPSRPAYGAGLSRNVLVPDAGLLVRRIGFDGRFSGSGSINHYCSQQVEEGTSARFSVKNVVGDLIQGRIEQTTLNFIRKLKKLGLKHDLNVNLKPMEIFGFVLRYKKHMPIG